MTHTLESLMALARTMAERYRDLQKYYNEESVSDYRTFHDGLQSAITEVLAELQREQADNVAMSMLADEYKAERDTLQSQLAEAKDMTRDHYWSKVDSRCKELESQLINCRPSVKNDLNNFDRFMLRKYDGQTPNDCDAAELARLIALLDYIDSLAHGAAPDMTRDHYWSKVDARCKELEAKVESQAAEIERHILEVDASRDRIYELEDKVAEMESQEPVAYLHPTLPKAISLPDLLEQPHHIQLDWTKGARLYLAPGAATHTEQANKALRGAADKSYAIAKLAQAAPAQWMKDVLATGVAVTVGGVPVDPFSIYKEAAPAAPKEPCIHKDVPSSCYRVRCQLGSKCIDDDMSFRAAPAAQRLSDAECAELINQHFFPDMRPDFQHYRAFRRAIETAFAAKNGITLEQKHATN